MSEYLLIHGGVHDRSCWDRLIPALERLGHSAVAIDLPGRGDSADRLTAVTLEDYTEAIADAVEALGPSPVLVAHSMGGVSTSQYVEHHPKTIAGVIYISAVVPANGATGMSTLAEAGAESMLLGEGVWSFSQDGASATIDPEAGARAFYGRCAPEVVEEAVTHLCPEAAAPLRTPLELGAGFTSVPKIYIGALEDRTVPPALQQRLAERAGAAFRTIDADHSPFFSAVDELAARLHEAGEHLRNLPD